jgi:hypothetical protein
MRPPEPTPKNIPQRNCEDAATATTMEFNTPGKQLKPE